MDRPAWIVSAEEAGVRLDKFLAASGRLGSRRRVSIALERGRVFLNDQEASLRDASKVLKAGDAVRIWMDRPGSAARRPRRSTIEGLQIVYEDDVLLVANKPAGLLTVPLERRADAPSAYDYLVALWRSHGKVHPLVVHRIDRDTSGLVLFARNARAQLRLKDQFKRREARRTYWALVYGHPSPPSGRWEDRLRWDQQALVQRKVNANDKRGVDASCSYKTIERFKDSSLLEIELETGKRNQIRIQAALRGHPLIGERRYVGESTPARPVAFGRQALHAYRLAFSHPDDGRWMEFEAPLPADFSDLLTRLRRR